MSLSSLTVLTREADTAYQLAGTSDVADGGASVCRGPARVTAIRTRKGITGIVSLLCHSLTILEHQLQCELVNRVGIRQEDPFIVALLALTGNAGCYSDAAQHGGAIERIHFGNSRCLRCCN
eukprot:3355139-Rhodomonas_salina.1